MANTASAIKRVRSNERKRVQNKVTRTRARSVVRTSREALEGDNLAEAKKVVLEAASELDKAANKGAIHPRNAARRKGRLMKQLAALQTEAK